MGLQIERDWGYEILWALSTAILAYGISLAFYRCMHCQSHLWKAARIGVDRSASVTSFKDSRAQVSRWVAKLVSSLTPNSCHHT